MNENGDGRIWLEAHGGNDGLQGLVYPAGILTAPQVCAIVANLLHDLLGDNPDMRDILVVQKTMMDVIKG